MGRFVYFLRKSFPYLMAIGLWRLSVPWWNPAGILAIIPIFYCTFVRPKYMFGIFGLLMCFLIDYKFDTVLYWTTLFCIFYAINGFQTFIDLTRANKNAIDVFMIFFATAIMILFLNDVSWTNLFNTICLFIWTTVLYEPITKLIGGVSHD